LAILDLKHFSFNNLTDPHDLDVVQQWVVDDFLPASAVTMISGESGSGKSTILLLLAQAVANGEPFLGHPTHPTKVLILDRENGATIYKERFNRLNIPKQENIAYWGGWDDPEPQGPDFEAYVELAKVEKPLIIFDSFIAFMKDGSEQDATEVRRYMNSFRRLAQAGATVVFIQHKGNGDNTKEYRGSSDIKASVDMAWVLTAKDRLQNAKLRNIKSREGMVENIAFFLEDANLMLLEQSFIPDTDPDWKPVHDMVRQHAGFNQSQIVGLLPDITPARVRKILMAGAIKKSLTIEKGLNNASLYSIAG
jgi:hypothetical protein